MNIKKKTLKESFIEALVNYNKKDFKTAEIFCYKILSIDPYHFDSISLLASINAINRDYEKAKELMLKAVEIQPKNTSSLNNLGTAYRELGNPKEAIRIYKKILEIDPKHTNANYNLGLVYYSLGELKKAKSYLKKTTEIQNNYAMAFFSLANVHVELKELKEALSNYQKAIDINPKIVSFYNNLGLLYRELNDFENAKKCYKKAIEIKPNHISSHHNLAQIYKEIGKFEKAINSHETVVKLESENLMNYYFLSELKEDILNVSLKNKIEKTLAKDKITINNLAYGNYLLAKYERKNKNYEKELNYLIKGHKNFYISQKRKFDLGLKYCFDDILQIQKGVKVSRFKLNNNTKIKPIFIFGVPRCGSTLVERIIVSGKKFIPLGEETGIIGNFVTSKILEKNSLDLGDANDIRNELLGLYKDKGLVLEKYNYTFTDKSLDNFFHLNLIKEIFPDAKLINCKRNTLSSIMSIFQNNLKALAWTHDLDNIFKYFDNYFKIMKKYSENDFDHIYELNLEKLINDPENESKKLMEYCGLTWDKKCLEFYKRKDLFSKTASNIQVREAIYKQTSSKYLPYKKFLDKYGKKYSWFN